MVKVELEVRINLKVSFLELKVLTKGQQELVKATKGNSQCSWKIGEKLPKFMKLKCM